MNERTVHVAVYNALADWEICYLTAYLRNGKHQSEPGRFRIVTVGPSREPVVTMGGLQALPDIALDELVPADSAMLVLAGSDLWDEGDSLAPFAAKAGEFLSAGIPVAAICGATAGLAATGLLEDRPHTSAARAYLEAVPGYHGAVHFVDELVVRDGDLITASPVAPVEFARAAFERLDVFEPGVLASWYKLYGQQDAQGFFELISA